MTALLYSLAALCLVLSIASYLAVRLRERRIAAARDEAPIKPVTFSPTPAKARHIRTYKGPKQYDETGRLLPRHPQRSVH